jgi:hypothetical protein
MQQASSIALFSACFYSGFGHHAFPKRQPTTIVLHGVISQEIQFFGEEDHLIKFCPRNILYEYFAWQLQ